MSEAEARALLIIAQTLEDFIVDTASEVNTALDLLREEAWTELGTNTDHWELMGFHGDELKNPNRQGLERIYALFRDKKSGKYYQISLDSDVKGGKVNFYDPHFSTWKSTGGKSLQGWKGDGLPPGWQRDWMLPRK